jgi:hypothetical protein
LVLFLSASSALLVRSELCRAGEPAARPLRTDDKKVSTLNGMSRWLEAQLSESERDRPATGNQRVEAYYCSCYDEPNKHYPYSIVVLKTPNGDLVARPEGTDGALFFTPLAIRYGNRYCEIDSEKDCYGSFSHPCEFTDFRYGPYLAEFFPTCKSE